MSRIVAVLSEIPQLSKHLQIALPNLIFKDFDVLGKSIVELENMKEADILVADANHLIPYIDKLPSFKWVQLTWAGAENLIQHLKQMSHVPYIFTRFTGTSFGYAMSEYVVAQIVNFERDLKKQSEHQENSLWLQDGKIIEHRRLCDLTVGILGLGEIGKFIARVLKTFGAQIWGMTRTLPAKKDDCINIHVTTNGLKEILENCDYIINVLPSTQLTRGLLNGNVLETCKNKKSIFMNIGRGSVITEKCLINALEKNWISGAILDVFETEPLPKSSPLWQMKQVVITPHIAGISKPQDIAKLFSENYKIFSNGEKLKNVIDLKQGY